MAPRISGGTRVDMFNSEFRARLSLIVSPLPSFICTSKALINSILISWPKLAPLYVRITRRFGRYRLTSKRTLDLGRSRPAVRRPLRDKTRTSQDHYENPSEGWKVARVGPSIDARTRFPSMFNGLLEWPGYQDPKLELSRSHWHPRHPIVEKAAPNRELCLPHSISTVLTFAFIRQDRFWAPPARHRTDGLYHPR